MIFNLLFYSYLSQATLSDFLIQKNFKPYKFKFVRCFTTNNHNQSGFFCINNNYKKNLLISAPHSKLEEHTYQEAVQIFLKTKSRFLAVSTKHRCSSDVASQCSGTTNVCGKKNTPYRISDVAHNTTSVFYKFHKIAYEKYSTSIIQLHEMKRKDLSFIISAGSKKGKRSKFISNKIMFFLNENKSIKKSVSCQFSFSELCGTTNTVGRLVNGSNDPCKKASRKINEKFIHIEQNYRLFDSKKNNPSIILTDMINKFF